MGIPQQSLTEIREEIDSLDSRLIKLLKQRQDLVGRAGRLKTDEDTVRAPSRVEEVITKIRHAATQIDLNPDVAESVYRPMIATFIQQELKQLTGSAQSDN